VAAYRSLKQTHLIFLCLLARYRSGWKFVAGLLFGLFLWLGVWLFLIAGQLGRPHPDNVWVAGAYELKTRAAERLSGKRKVLLVGGSATMFGVNSSLVADGLDRPTVNFAVNAGLGAHALPAEVDKHIQSGDIVLMPLEYRLLLWDGRPSYVTISWVLEHPKTLQDWNLKSLAWGLWSLPLKRVLQGYQSFSPDELGKGLYGPHRLDQNGDQIQTRALQRTPQQWEGLVRLSPERYDELYAKTTLGLDLWHYWWRRWQLRGACLVVVPPPFLDHPAYNTQSYETFLNAIPDRVKARGVDYLGHPRDVFFPVEAMFDTNYHLTDEGRSVYTNWLLGVLHDANVPCLQLR